MKNDDTDQAVGASAHEVLDIFAHLAETIASGSSPIRNRQLDNPELMQLAIYLHDREHALLMEGGQVDLMQHADRLHGLPIPDRTVTEPDWLPPIMLAHRVLAGLSDWLMDVQLQQSRRADEYGRQGEDELAVERRAVAEFVDVLRVHVACAELKATEHEGRTHLAVQLQLPA